MSKNAHLIFIGNICVLDYTIIKPKSVHVFTAIEFDIIYVILYISHIN